MLACLNCSGQLNEFPTPSGPSLVCPSCGARSLSIDLVKEQVGPEFLTLLGQKVREGPSGCERACPHCATAMHVVDLVNMDPGVTIDICVGCRVIWFDPDEYEKVYMAARGEDDPDAGQGGEGSTLSLSRPDHFLQWIPIALGMPVELGGSKRIRQPWVTWGLTGVLVVVFILQAVSGNVFWAIKNLGFMPSQWSRYLGVTLVTSFFLHVWVLHLVVNVYALLVFGDNVEDHLGRMWFVGLLAMSHVAGMLLHAMLPGSREIPCVGASAGICGVMAYYAIVFPKAKLGMLPSLALVFVTKFRLIRMPAVVFLAMYVGFQTLLAVRGGGGVAYLAHLGGLGVGAIVGVIVTKRRKIPLKE